MKHPLSLRAACFLFHQDDVMYERLSPDAAGCRCNQIRMSRRIIASSQSHIKNTAGHG